MNTKRLFALMVCATIIVLAATKLVGEADSSRQSVTMTGHVIDLHRFLTARFLDTDDPGVPAHPGVSARLLADDRAANSAAPVGFWAGRWSVPPNNRGGSPIYLIVFDPADEQQTKMHRVARELSGRLVRITAKTYERDGLQGLRIEKIEPIRIAGEE